MDDVDRIAAIPLHADAKSEVKDRAARYAAILTSQAKVNAAVASQNVVLQQHVVEASLAIMAVRRRPPWWVQWGRALAGTILGIGFNDLILELRQSNVNSWWALLYVALTVAGTTFLAWASVRER